jgi:hypothetical protein
MKDKNYLNTLNLLAPYDDLCKMLNKLTNKFNERLEIKL